MYFGNYGFANKGLDKYLKSAVSEYPSSRNMVKAAKHLSNYHLSNYHSGIFIILTDYGQGFWI